MKFLKIKIKRGQRRTRTPTKSEAVSEADFLFEKTYVCPVCDEEFHSKKIPYRKGKAFGGRY